MSTWHAHDYPLAEGYQHVNQTISGRVVKLIQNQKDLYVI